jgi:hypothetical protein
MRDRVFGYVEEWMHVGIEGVEPLVSAVALALDLEKFNEVNELRKLLDILNHHLIRMIVEENVNGTHRLKSLLDDIFTVVFPLQIGGVEMTLPTILFNHLFGRLSILFLLGKICDVNISAFHGTMRMVSVGIFRVGVPRTKEWPWLFQCHYLRR